MKYYQIIVNSGGLKSKRISLSPVDPDLINYFSVEKVKLDEPVLIRAYYYQGDDIEEDYVCAGNPQVVSEEFKNLVEELDPKAAQFFTTQSINCVTQKKYYVMHVTQTVYCLDREHSKFLPGLTGKVKDIAVGIVDTSKIPEDVHIFRLGENTARHYVSQKFYREYRKRKMRGMLFLLRTLEQ